MQRPSVSLEEFPKVIVSLVLQDNTTDNAAGVAEKKAPLSVCQMFLQPTLSLRVPERLH